MDTETTEQPRDDGGRFATSEEKFGLEGTEIDQGYIQRPDYRPAPPQAEEEYGSDDDSLRALAKKYRESKGGPNDDIIDRSIRYVETGEPVPENWAQTVEQASTDLSNVHNWEREIFEQKQLDKVAKDIDAKRAERTKNNPKLAEHYGLDEVAEAKSDEPAADLANIEVKPGELHPEVERALKHPQIREAIESEISETHRVRESYSATLQSGQQMLQAAVGALAPQLDGMPLEHWPQAIQALAQVDPVRANLLKDTLNNWGAIQQAAQQEQAQRAYAEQQQFEASVKSEDARLIAMVGGEKAANEANQALVTYLADHGVARDQMLPVIMQNPVLRTAEARKTILEAAKYRELRDAPKPKPVPKEAPKVVKPGVSLPKGARVAESVGTAREKLTSSGSVEDAYALYTTKRKGRG